MSRSLDDPRFEHDACGVGFVARLSGEPGHDLVHQALVALARLEHRGALAADGKSGDGAGILTQVPRRLFAREAARLGAPPGAAQPLGVGMVFLPPAADGSEAVLERALEEQGFRVLGWRSVPVDPSALGEGARRTLPAIRQVLVLPAPGMADDVFERRLSLARKTFERGGTPGYVCSLSSRTVVYKALCIGHELPHLYPDLRDPLFESALAVFHQRYSTNTLPSWEMAQPFRLLAHNGEINTLWGNLAGMRAREAELPAELRPALWTSGSDSAALDSALELLVQTGRPLAHALATLVPPAWEEVGNELTHAARSFFRTQAPVIEPWDGPAALAFADGRFVGAALDRNGLRPCRYKITSGGLIVAGSEVGVVPLDDDVVVEKGRLGPGEMLLLDLEEHRLLRGAELERWLAGHPSRVRWRAVPLPVPEESDWTHPALPRLLRLHGLTREEMAIVLPPMVEDEKDATWSMGDDTPIAALARSPRGVYDFLRQRFAQVTNPPIDPLREVRMMSLRSWLGPRPGLVGDDREVELVELRSPVMTEDLLAGLRAQGRLRLVELPCTFFVQGSDLEGALDSICHRAEAAVRDGAQLLVLSNRDVTLARAPVPAPLALGAVHHHLVEAGLRTRADLVVEAGDCWDVHHLAVLVGCGAGAVVPWLALAVARDLDPERGETRLVRAFEAGLRKVMSRMGVSSVASYRGGQLFEALGLAPEVVDRCFRGMPTRIGGRGFAGLADEVAARHRAALAAEQPAELPDYGRVRFRRGDDAEHHAWRPAAVRALHRAVGVARGAGYGQADPAAWAEFNGLTSGADPVHLRDLLELLPAGPPLAPDAVERAESIAVRFVSSAMSLGALSPEAHRTLAVAMNRLGARSNTGEGGEDPADYEAEGERRDNKVKQVASGRFGVTAGYLARAEEIEIKMAQGSKPGEGGQLPGHKVTALIARLRHTQPGIPLISPPPHHDIYSIEDLAQLIYDLKAVNPRARVGVKLVAEAGVGTIAAGVAKAYAEFVTISGHSGGTGASPLSSIKHAGVPWELGLAEAQQVLIRNGLRSRIRVRTDGGLMTGRDVVVATLLGAEEFAFGTAPLIALGCDMARQCHLNTCPTGIATQRPELRAKFRGSPDQVISYFLQLAGAVRELLATLGLPSLEAATGRVDLLRQANHAGGLDLSALLRRADGDLPRCTQPRNDRPEREEPLDVRLLREAAPAIEQREQFRAVRNIENHHRAVGARLSGEIALRWPGLPLEAASIRLHFRGSAGQSFGAFATTGLRLTLEGEANDYVGKGLCGGEIVLRPTGAARRAPHRHVILGNVALYGATSGRLFAAGRAGERFAVRNSGAVAVVEGVGHHGCEYMTGGCVLVLGQTGWNFAAGMTGGRAYVLDETGDLAARLGDDAVLADALPEEELEMLRELTREHQRATGSARARWLLDRWDRTSRLLRAVLPRYVVEPPRPEVPVPAEESVLTIQVPESTEVTA